jgi:hypothetical protein
MTKNIPLPRFKVNDIIVWANKDESDKLINAGFGRVISGLYYEIGEYSMTQGWIYTVNTGLDKLIEVREEDIIRSL